MVMVRDKNLRKLSKILAYVLGRKPDEFGLFPDVEGFVKIKECLKALHEEEGWGFVRKASIDEVVYSLPNPAIEIEEDRVRAIQREHLPKRCFDPDPPGILFTCIRQRAYANTLEKGISPMGRRHILLSADKHLALRMGRRFDPKPMLLTVNAAQAHDLGSIFLRAGEKLFLCRHIPVGSFYGPAPPKEKKARLDKEKPRVPQRSETPGSYFPDLAEQALPKHQTKKQRRRDEVAWKSERRRKTKHKIN